MGKAPDFGFSTVLPLKLGGPPRSPPPPPG